MSLRLRLLLGTAAALVSGLILVDVVTYVMVTGSLRSQVDDTLRQVHTAAQVVAEGDRANWSTIPDVAPGLFVAIVAPDGTALYTAPLRGDDEESLTVDLVDVGQGTRAGRSPPTRATTCGSASSLCETGRR